ncbi:MAG: HcpA family protein, partial [Deltaproteobacteria bacterium]
MRIRTWAVIALGVIATGAWATDVETPPPQAIEQVQEKPVETSPQGQIAPPASTDAVPAPQEAASPAPDTPPAPPA